MGGSSRIQGVGMGWGSCCRERSELLQDLRVRFAWPRMTENAPGDFSHPPAAVWGVGAHPCPHAEPQTHRTRWEGARQNKTLLLQ